MNDLLIFVALVVGAVLAGCAVAFAHKVWLDRCDARAAKGLSQARSLALVALIGAESRAKSIEGTKRYTFGEVGSADKGLMLAIGVLLPLCLALGGAVVYLATDTHLVRCETHTSLAFADQDGEPMTTCWDVITDEQVS